MVQARQRKREQSLLLWGSFAGAVVALFFGTLWQLPNDLWLLVLALGGAGVGFVVSNAIALAVKRRSNDAHMAEPDA
jgi:cyanate permease